MVTLKKINTSGLLYIDNEIICIKNIENKLFIYENTTEFRLIAEIQIAERTNQINRFKEGILYFENRNTIFYSFNSKSYTIEEDRFYFGIFPTYSAYTTIEKKGTIIIESNKKIEIPLINSNAEKKFLQNGIIQAEKNVLEGGKIVFNDLENNGIVKWEYYYEDFTNSPNSKLRSKLIYDFNRLFLVLECQKSCDLYVLDIESGNILEKLEGFCNEIFQDNQFIYTTKFNNCLCRINSETLEIEVWDVNELIKLNGFDNIHDHRCKASNNKFYFTQTIGSSNAKFGILDWEKKELIYKYDFEPQNGGIGSINVELNKIFIHTQDKSLNIFELE